MPPPIRAFTLIELLVVVTIIVVLLALLTPALDKAIYSAELTQCAANMKGIASGALVYAAANKRMYPARPKGTMPSVNVLRQDAWDFRPVLRTFVRVNSGFNDVLSPQAVDLESNAAQTIGPATLPWFGYQYAGEQPMRRVGDRWTCVEVGSAERRAYRLLVSDMMSYGAGAVYCGHNERENRMRAEAFDNETYLDEYGNTGAPSYAATLGRRYTVSRWLGSQPDPAPTFYFDTNSAYDDGSVVQLDKVSLKQNDDERLARVKLYAADTDVTRWFYVPAEHH